MNLCFTKSLTGMLMLTRILVLLITLMGTSLYAQDPPQYGTPFAGVSDPRDVNMYQVHTRIFSSAGNFQGVISRLDQIRALGINTIYLMPHYPMGTDPRASGSPYCIKDFKGVGAEYGSLSDLRQLVDGAHARGMAVILDFIVNQTSFDHPWITQHPDWYLRDGSGNIIALFPDVAALDMNNTAMRAAMIDAMRYWVFAANVDGFRCDFANNAPVGFWSAVISNLRGITSHKLLMLAEGDRVENFQAGFDMNFGDKWFWDALRPVSSGTSVAQFQTTTNTEYSLANSTQQVARYTTNHDIVGRNDIPILPFQLFQNHNGVVANFLVCAYLRGVPFLMSGQEVDFSSFVAYPWYNPKINWSANTGAAADFTKILNFRTSSTAIRRGTLTSYSNTNVCAFTRINGTEKVSVMVNMRNSTQTFVIPSGMAGSYRDAYTNANVTLTSGATQSLGAYGYIVLTNASVPPVAVTGVTVSPTSASISASTTRQLTATVLPSNATNQNVSWSSNNTAVATVNSSGLVTGVAAGTATITVTTQDGNRTATSSITVTPSSNFTVNFFRPSNWGTGIRIYWWAAQPAGILPDGTWPGVLMTNSGNGWYSYTFTNVTSTNLIFNDGSNQTADLNRNRTGWYLNNVWYDTNPGTPIPVTGVTVNPTSATVNINATTQLTATIAPANATNKTVTWTSSNSTVATVSATGLVTGRAGGTATITVTTQDGNRTANCSITVPSSGTTTYYQIRNRWQANAYLYDAGNGQVRYGTTPSGNSYQWAQVDQGGGFFLLRNRATGNLMHVENQNGSVQCTTGDPTWWSAMWSIPAATDGWSYVVNRWQTSERIHIEGLTGFAQYANAQTGWHSAMWQFVNPQTGMMVASGDGSGLSFAEEDVPMEVFPNPAKGKQFTISVPQMQDDETAIVIIKDINGKTALDTKVNKAGKITHDLAPGLYFLRVQTSSVSAVKKVIIE